MPSPQHVVGILAAILASAPLLPASAQPQPDSRTTIVAPDTNLRLRRFVHGSGLKVLTRIDRRAPRITLALAIGAGRVDEPQPHSRVAQLAPRVLRRRSANTFGANARLESFHDVGLTSTTFVDDLPSEQLELGVRMASARLDRLMVSDAALQQVASTTTAPLSLGAIARTKLRSLAYQGSWPLGHSDTAPEAAPSPSDVMRFHQLHYRPMNAVLVVIGDFDPSALNRLLDRHVSVNDAATPPPPREFATPPPQNSRRSLSSRNPTQYGALALGWAIKTSDEREHDALRLCAQILVGNSSAASRELVTEQDTAIALHGGVEAVGRQQLFWVTAQVRRGASPLAAAPALEAAVYRLRRKGPSPVQLARARRELITRTWMLLDQPQRLAQQVALEELIHGDGRSVARRLTRLKSVTVNDVQRVASQYLLPHRMSVVESLPAPTAVRRESK